MAALFALAAAVQLNDPDPIRWIAVYGLAAIISGYAAVTSRVPRRAAIVLAAAALAWAVVIGLGGPSGEEYRQMFQAWEMRSPGIEEAREATGLVIVAAWMLALVIRNRRR